MKTSYLLRQCPWMTTDERRVARYTARRAEQAICAGGTALNPAHIGAIFALCTAFAMYQRVQAKLAEALAGDGDFVALGHILTQSQAAFLRAQEHLEKITARANGIALPESTLAPTPVATSAPCAAPSPPAPLAAPGAPPSIAALLATPAIASLFASPEPAVSGGKPLPQHTKTFADLDERRRRRNANKAARKRH